MSKISSWFVILCGWVETCWRHTKPFLIYFQQFIGRWNFSSVFPLSPSLCVFNKEAGRTRQWPQNFWNNFCYLYRLLCYFYAAAAAARCQKWYNQNIKTKAIWIKYFSFLFSPRANTAIKNSNKDGTPFRVFCWLIKIFQCNKERQSSPRVSDYTMTVVNELKCKASSLWIGWSDIKFHNEILRWKAIKLSPK